MVNKNARRKRVFDKLTTQLATGTKTVKKSATEKAPLTEANIKRINKELVKLKACI